MITLSERQNLISATAKLLGYRMWGGWANIVLSPIGHIIYVISEDNTAVYPNSLHDESVAQHMKRFYGVEL